MQSKWFHELLSGLYPDETVINSQPISFHLCSHPLPHRPCIILKQIPASYHLTCEYFHYISLAIEQGREKSILNHFFIAGHLVCSNFSLLQMT